MPGFERNCKPTPRGLRPFEPQFATIAVGPNAVVFTDVAAEYAKMARMLDGLGEEISSWQEAPCWGEDEWRKMGRQRRMKSSIGIEVPP